MVCSRAYSISVGEMGSGEFKGIFQRVELTLKVCQEKAAQVVIINVTCPPQIMSYRFMANLLNNGQRLNLC